MATTPELITSLYVSMFNRAPDQDGFNFWLNQAQLSGLNDFELMDQMAAGFSQHPAFDAIYGDVDNAGFVEALYLNIGGNPGDADGQQFWVDRLNAGEARSVVVAEFTYGVLTADITAENFPGLSAEELAAAQLRQDQLQNRVDVSQFYVVQMGAQSNLSPGTDPMDLDSLMQDLGYVSSIAILNDLGADTAVRDERLDFLATNPTPTEVIETFDPGILPPGPTPEPGDTIMLTPDADRGADFVGTADEDTFDAPISTIQFLNGNTLNTGDVLDGNGGNNTLQAELINDGFVTGIGAVRPTTTRIQDVKITALQTTGFNTVTLDAADMVDINNIGSFRSNASLTIQDLTTLTNQGIARNTDAITIWMDHTQNVNTGSGPSDLSVYFDENYLLAGRAAEGRVFFWLLDQDADLVGDPLLTNNNVDGIRFSIAGGPEIALFDPAALEADTHPQFVAALQPALRELISNGTLPAGTTLTLDTENTRTTFLDNGQRSSEVPSIVLTTGDGSPVEPVGFRFNEDETGDFNIWARSGSDFEVEDQLVTSNIELHKVGRGSEGGDLIVGGKSGSQFSDGVEVFNVRVHGDDSKPSNLATLRTTNNDLEQIHISTHPDYVDGDSHASLTVRGTPATLINPAVSPFGQPSLEMVNANEFLGDLSLGSRVAVQNLTTLNATGGGDVDFTGDIVNLGNPSYQDYSYINDKHYSYTTGSGDDVVTVRVDPEVSASSQSSLTVRTGGGDDVVDVQHSLAPSVSQPSNHFNLMNIDIDASSGDNVVNVAGYGATDVTTGAGNDLISTDWDWLDQAPATAVTVATQLQNGGATASWLVNAVTSASGPVGNGNTQYKMFQTTVVVEYQGIRSGPVQIDYTDYVTSAESINQAVMQAIEDDPRLSKLLDVSEVRDYGLMIESQVARALNPGDLNIDFIAPKYAEEINGSNFTNNRYNTDDIRFDSRGQVTETDLEAAWQAWYPNSEGIGQGSGTGIYAGVANAQAMFNAMWNSVEDNNLDLLDGQLPPYQVANVRTGINSNTLTQNVIDAGAGTDVIALSSNTGGSFDTVVLNDNFGHNVIMNFNTGAVAGVADALDFRGYLDPIADGRGASVNNDRTLDRVQQQAQYSFSGLVNNAVDHNSVVAVNLSAVWTELTANADDRPLRFEDVTAAMVQRALQEQGQNLVNTGTVNNNDQMEGSQFVIMLIKDREIILNGQDNRSQLAPLSLNDDNAKIFSGTISDWDADDNEWTYSLTERGTLEFGRMFSSLTSITAASITGTAAADAKEVAVAEYLRDVADAQDPVGALTVAEAQAALDGEDPPATWQIRDTAENILAASQMLVITGANLVSLSQATTVALAGQMRGLDNFSDLYDLEDSWSNLGDEDNSAIVDEARTLTLNAPPEGTDLGELTPYQITVIERAQNGAQFEWQPEQPDVNVFTVQEAIDAVELPAEYSIEDTAENILGNVGTVDDVVTAAAAVELFDTELVTVQEARDLLALRDQDVNFVGQYSLEDEWAVLSAPANADIVDGAEARQPLTLTDAVGSTIAYTPSQQGLVDRVELAQPGVFNFEELEEPVDTRVTEVMDGVWVDGTIDFDPEDADQIRLDNDVDYVTFDVNVEPLGPGEGSMYAVTGLITNFTAGAMGAVGDILNLEDLDLGGGIQLTIDPVSSGFTPDEATPDVGDLDIFLKLGANDVPFALFSLADVDAAALGLDTTDGASLVNSLEAAEWLVL
ncbi:MAG: DUF4214 domain-containing protein [Lamprobacter sp.]|uniref:DUF4214 domain-containing protein n=1 Tax=Lamprobacter sp. TaxID=3100796 RepID=UPI002B256CA6|nr:DUF4214 domain-containing protein [Lamprobacter sp.]MEA3638312.1 DUF4214 domain-containing protein [Lamprobacter sp.]